jgi:hypothetical protein
MILYQSAFFFPQNLSKNINYFNSGTMNALLPKKVLKMFVAKKLSLHGLKKMGVGEVREIQETKMRAFPIHLSCSFGT